MVHLSNSQALLAAVFPDEVVDVAAILISLNIIAVMLLLLAARGIRALLQAMRQRKERQQ